MNNLSETTEQLPLLADLKGKYHFKSPYHKRVKMLPFNLNSTGEAHKVYYRGNDCYEEFGQYDLVTLLRMLSTEFLIPGEVKFPKGMIEI